MAISFVSSSTGASANGNPITLTLPSSMAQDDFVIVALAVPYVTDVVLVSGINSDGWTQLADLYEADTETLNFAVWCKFMPATPDVNVLLWGPGGALTEGDSAVAMAFRGVDRSNPFDAVSTTATGTNTANPDPASITISGDPGVWVVAAVASATDNGPSSGSAGYSAFPSGYATNATSNAGADTNDSVVGLAYNSSPSTTENPGTFTYVNADAVTYCWAAATMAIRPAETTGIRYVGFAENTANNGAGGTITLPTCLENDIVIVGVSHPVTFDTIVSMTTSGYTTVADIYGSDTEDTNLGVFYKVMGSTPDTTAVWAGCAQSTCGEAAIAMVFRNIDTTNPMDVAATTATGASSGRPVTPTIDPVTPGGMAVLVGSTGQDTIDTAYVYPGGFMGRAIANSGDTDRGGVGMCYARVALVGDPVPSTTWYEAKNVGTGSALPFADPIQSWAAVSMVLRIMAPLPVYVANHAVGAVRV